MCPDTDRLHEPCASCGDAFTQFQISSHRREIDLAEFGSRFCNSRSIE